MTKQELEEFIIEAACISMEAEVKYFVDYFNINYINLEYDIKDGLGTVYIIDKENKNLLKTMNYKDALLIWKTGCHELSSKLDEFVHHYNLEDTSIVVHPDIINEEDSNNEIETI